MESDKICVAIQLPTTGDIDHRVNLRPEFELSRDAIVDDVFTRISDLLGSEVMASASPRFIFGGRILRKDERLLDIVPDQSMKPVLHLVLRLSVSALKSIYLDRLPISHASEKVPLDAQKLPSQSSTSSLPTHVIYQVQHINGIPFLVKRKQRKFNLARDQVVRITNELGEPVLLVSPEGKRSLIAQGYYFHHIPSSSAFHYPTTTLVQPTIPHPTRTTSTHVPTGMPPEVQQGQQNVAEAAPRGLFPALPPAEQIRLHVSRIWLFFRLAFMVGFFSANNSSWPRVALMTFIALLIFFWQCGLIDEPIRLIRSWLDNGAERHPPNHAAIVDPNLPQGQQEQPQDHHIIQRVASIFRVVEQLVFVFFATLLPRTEPMMADNGQEIRAL